MRCSLRELKVPYRIRHYEAKVAELEREKLLCLEKLDAQAEPKGSFEEILEPVLMFLANPWKISESGNTHARRLVLKLAFEDRLSYCRKEGARTS
ncbi:hypothetical protein So717_38790 [Roseobacter cerasinus]|uniref:Uncharacterized protein n=1 Tax=Roseobacter cerasinus TaxID=2602289 RepID=A0A640W0X8_9RHOB|nr:hypothetical protein So717_38790 [Roseobacter cerasinus]